MDRQIHHGPIAIPGLLKDDKSDHRKTPRFVIEITSIPSHAGSTSDSNRPFV